MFGAAAALTGAYSLLTQNENTAPPIPDLTRQEAPPEVELSPAQKSEARQVVESDPIYRSLTRSREPDIVSTATWTRAEDELVGAAVEVVFKPEKSFPMRTWPYIKNQEDLLGDSHNWPNRALKPGVEPEVGYFRASASHVERLLILVDSDRKSVVSISPIGMRTKMRVQRRGRNKINQLEDQ
jgi:hypothetical protein